MSEKPDFSKNPLYKHLHTSSQSVFEALLEMSKMVNAAQAGENDVLMRRALRQEVELDAASKVTAELMAVVALNKALENLLVYWMARFAVLREKQHALVPTYAAPSDDMVLKPVLEHLPGLYSKAVAMARMTAAANNTPTSDEVH